MRNTRSTRNAIRVEALSKSEAGIHPMSTRMRSNTFHPSVKKLLRSFAAIKRTTISNVKM